MTSVLLADDHQLVRQGLKAIIDRDEELTVVAEASDGVTALQKVEQFRPRVLVTDVVMPGMSGIELAGEVNARFPDTKTLILSMYDSEAYVVEAFKKGACGYMTKGSSAKELLTAITEVAAGRRYLSSGLSERAINAYVERSSKAPRKGILTPREKEVVNLTVEGLSAPEVGIRLGISPRTAEAHRANAMAKLGVRNQTELVKLVISSGLLQAN